MKRCQPARDTKLRVVIIVFSEFTCAGNTLLFQDKLEKLYWTVTVLCTNSPSNNLQELNSMVDSFY